MSGDIEKFTLTMCAEPVDEGGYVSYCIELDVASCGDTLDEAMENIRDAVMVYLYSLNETNDRESVLRAKGIQVSYEPRPDPDFFKEHRVTVESLPEGSRHQRAKGFRKSAISPGGLSDRATTDKVVVAVRG